MQKVKDKAINKVFIYNTLSRSLEEFKPIDSKNVRMYTCGPTVYNFAHIGNLRTFIFEDVLKKTLVLAGFPVFHVMNITDVGHLTGDGDDGEDKVEKEAKKEKKSIQDIIDFYTSAFFKDIDALNIKRADVYPYASKHVSEMLDLIARLEKNGHTYTSGGNVYYSIDTFKDYGALGGLKFEQMEAGKRISVDKNKKNPHDFVLWFTKSKFENQEMKWDSPYGRGYPGWHLECSAMSMKYLGESFDIHCGGVDAICVHHTNEIAQTEGATGKKMANYWMHSEFLLSEKGKMSKSTGDFTTLSLLQDKGINPLAYRYFCLGGHYRKQLQFSFDALIASQNALNSIYSKIDKIKNDAKFDNSRSNAELLSEYVCGFKSALFNDLNTPVALSFIHKALSEKDLTLNDKLEFFAIADSVLSLSLLDRVALEKTNDEIPSKIIELANKRKDAKINKDYKTADEIRNKIISLGFNIKDTASGFEITKI